MLAANMTIIANALTKISTLTGRMDTNSLSQFMHRRYLLPTTRRIHHRRLSLQKSVSLQRGHFVSKTMIGILGFNFTLVD